MIIENNITGEVIETLDESIEETEDFEMPMLAPTTEERIEALEMALLEVILNG